MIRRNPTKLNQHYQRLKDEIKGTNQEQKLIEAQSAWQKFRNLNCEYVSERYKGGSIESLIHLSCPSRLTEQRIEPSESYSENARR